MRINSISNVFCSNSNIEHIEKKTSNDFMEKLQLKEKDYAKKTSQDNFVSKSGRTQSQFSGTMQERFEQMEQLNKETDWGALSDASKVKLLTDRYRSAFNEFDLSVSGLYEPYISSHTAIGDHYTNEFMKYLSKDGTAPLQSDLEACYKEAYYGDFSDDEIRASIMDKYKDSNTMESKCLMLDEMRRCGIIKNGEMEILQSIGMQVFKQVENTNKVALYGTNSSISQHPRFLNMFMSYAKGVGEGKNYNPNWTQVIEEAKNMYQQTTDNPYYDDIQNGMDDFLNDILYNLI